MFPGRVSMLVGAILNLVSFGIWLAVLNNLSGAAEHGETE